MYNFNSCIHLILISFRLWKKWGYHIYSKILILSVPCNVISRFGSVEAHWRFTPVPMWVMSSLKRHRMPGQSFSRTQYELLRSGWTLTRSFSITATLQLVRYRLEFCLHCFVLCCWLYLERTFEYCWKKQTTCVKQYIIAPCWQSRLICVHILISNCICPGFTTWNVNYVTPCEIQTFWFVTVLGVNRGYIISHFSCV